MCVGLISWKRCFFDQSISTLFDNNILNIHSGRYLCELYWINNDIKLFYIIYTFKSSFFFNVLKLKNVYYLILMLYGLHLMSWRFLDYTVTYILSQ